MKLSKLLNLKSRLQKTFEAPDPAPVPEEAPKDNIPPEGVDVPDPEFPGGWVRMFPGGRIVKFDNYAAATATDPRLIQDRAKMMEINGWQNNPESLPEMSKRPIVTSVEEQGKLITEQFNREYRRSGIKNSDL